MTATLQNFEIVKTARSELRVPVTDDGWPRPLTGLTVEWLLAPAAGETATVTKTTAGGGVTVPSSESGTAQAGARDSITLALAANSEDGFYQGRHIRLTGGAGAGQFRKIETYNGATREAVVDRPWKHGGAPDATTGYAIVDSAADVVIDDSDVSGLADGDYYHELRVIDGGAEPSVVMQGTATLVAGAP